MFGVAFLYAGSLWFLFIVEVPPCGWGWMEKSARPWGRAQADMQSEREAERSVGEVKVRAAGKLGRTGYTCLVT